MRADALEDILNCNVDFSTIGAVQLARCNRAAIEHHAGNIQPAQRHDDSRHILVAAADAHQAVEEIAARHQLNRVCDHFAADQRGFHALRAHRDAVVDGDGVELHRRAAGLANAFLERLGDLAQMHIAGADLRPGVGNPNNGLVQFFLAEADPAQIRARRGAAGAFGQRDALSLAFDRHVRSFERC